MAAKIRLQLGAEAEDRRADPAEAQRHAPGALRAAG